MRLTAARSAPWAFRVLISPMTLLERSRGRRRSLLIYLYALFITIAAVLCWRAASLRGLPDVGDPFDVAAFASSAEVRDDVNSAVLYREASARLIFHDSSGVPLMDSVDWSKANPRIRAWLDRNRTALALWRRATRRPKALWCVPDSVQITTPLSTQHDLVAFAKLALLEGSRLEQEGRPSEAAELYGGILRSSAHAGQASGFRAHFISTGILRFSSGRILSWAADHRVDAAAVRAVLGDAEAADAMLAPPSTMLKAEYITLRNELDSPWSNWDGSLAGFVWYHRLPLAKPVRLFLRREPERSKRVARLAFANWLAYCDRPSPPPLSSGSLRLYQVDATAPAVVQALSRDEIEAWFESTTWARLLMSRMSGAVVGQAGGERTIIGSLEISLAERCYRLDHYGASPRKLGALVGPYLARLPEGYSADEAAVGDGASEVGGLNARGR
jgi:hypothetical protein